MATIPGSQLFDATTPNPAFSVGDGGVTVAETSTGTGLPSPVANSFNLEVYTGGAPNPVAPEPGYQGLAILSPGGTILDLVAGAFKVTDIGITGGNTLIADGTAETVQGGSAFDNLILNGTGNTAIGGGAAGDNITVNGTADTVTGGTGPEDIEVNGAGNAITAGSGADTVNVYGNTNTITAGSGPDTINAFGNSETIGGGTGPGLINAFGTGDVIAAGSGNETINVFADSNTVTGGSGSDTIGVYSNNVLVNGGPGSGLITITGTNDTVAGGGTQDIGAWGGNFTFADSGPGFDDTVTGFSQAAGDSIQTPDNPTVVAATATQNGTDTVISFSDGSHLTLKYFNASDVNASFFHS